MIVYSRLLLETLKYCVITMAFYFSSTLSNHNEKGADDKSLKDKREYTYFCVQTKSNHYSWSKRIV